MRWKRITIANAIYTSPPPAAEPLLKEKPLKGSVIYESEFFFKKLGVFLTIAIWIVTLAISFFIAMLFQWTSTTEIKTTKDYSQIVVEENDMADYKIFVDIPEKYGALEQIEEPIRKTISLYMQANNLKLSAGIHEFSRTNGKLDEYINEEFQFEKIK